MDFASLRIGMVLGVLAVAGCGKTPPVADQGAASQGPPAAPPHAVTPAVHAAPLEAPPAEVAPAAYGEEVRGIETRWITDDYFAAVIAHPRQILAQRPLAGELRAWLDAAAADLGIVLAEVDQICFLMGPPEGPLNAAAPAPIITTWIFRFASPQGQRGMMQRFLGENQYRQTAHQDRIYYKDAKAPIALCAPDERTVMLASERNVKKALAASQSRSLLLARLAAVEGRPDVVGAVDALPLRPLLRRAAEAKTEHGPPSVWVQQLAETMHLLKAATLTVELADSPLARLTVEAESSQSAVKLEELAQGYHGTAALLLAALKSRWLRGEEGPGYAPLFDLASATLAGMKTTRAVRQVTVEAPAPAAMADLPAALESAFVAAMQGAARHERVQRLQLVGLAMHNHHVAQGSFPPGASRDAAGRPLLSWRVHLLPWLGEEELYRQFRLDQPWDSPHNRALLEKIPPVYQSPGAAIDGRTRIAAVRGAGTPFSLARGVALRDFTDGPDNTIILVECGPDRALPWTQPEDLPFDPHDPLAALGAIEGEGFLALFGDGRVEMIQSRIAAAELKALLTHAGGELLSPTP